MDILPRDPDLLRDLELRLEPDRLLDLEPLLEPETLLDLDLDRLCDPDLLRDRDPDPDLDLALDPDLLPTGLTGGDWGLPAVYNKTFDIQKKLKKVEVMKVENHI